MNFELTFAGSRLEHNNHFIAEVVYDILDHMATSFFEACLALNLALECISIEVNKERQTREGYVSNEMFMRQKYLYAKSYILSLNNILDFFESLKKINSVVRLPKEVSSEAKMFNQHFPNLKEFRDSIMHLGDRIQKKYKTQDIDLNKVKRNSRQPMMEMGKSGNKIGNKKIGDFLNTDLKIIGDELYSFGGFMDYKFHILLKNGDLGEFNLNFENLVFVKDVLQSVINSFDNSSFKWKGLKQTRPFDH